TVALNCQYPNQQGEREAEFINCGVWQRPAENLAKYKKKGSMTGVDGRIQTRTFEGQDGRTVFVTEVVADNVQLLERKSTTQNRSGQDSLASGLQPNQNQDQMNA